jgi:hypothetical protein
MIEIKRLLRGREKLHVLLGTRQNSFFMIRPQWFAQGERAKGLFRPRTPPALLVTMPIHLTWQFESSLRMETKLWVCCRKTGRGAKETTMLRIHSFIH